MNITTNPNNNEDYQIYFTQNENEMILQAKIAEQREYEKYITNSLKFKIDTRRLFEYLELEINNPNILVEAIIKKGFQNVLKSFPINTQEAFETVAFLNNILNDNTYFNPNEWIANIPNSIINSEDLINTVYAGFNTYGVNDVGAMFTQRNIILSLLRINRDRTFNTEGQKNITIDVDDITKQNNWLANVFPLQVQFLDNQTEAQLIINVNAFPQGSRVVSTLTIISGEAPIKAPEYVWFGETDNKAYKEIFLTY